MSFIYPYKESNLTIQQYSTIVTKNKYILNKIASFQSIQHDFPQQKNTGVLNLHSLQL